MKILIHLKLIHKIINWKLTTVIKYTKINSKNTEFFESNAKIENLIEIQNTLIAQLKMHMSTQLKLHKINNMFQHC